VTAPAVVVLPPEPWTRPDLTVDEWVARATALLRTGKPASLAAAMAALSVLLYAVGVDEDTAVQRAVDAGLREAAHPDEEVAA
jgi:hypothetical protein